MVYVYKGYPSGSECWNYNPNRAQVKLPYKIRGCYKYIKLKQAVLKRDNNRCRCCGNEGKQIHHLVDITKIIKEKGINTLEEAKACPEVWDLDKVVTICGACHSLTKRKLPIKICSLV
jgi:hypothetical protein